MNASTAKDQWTFSLGNLTYIGTEYDDAPTQAVKPQKQAPSGLVNGILAKLANWHRRRQVIQEMALMTDRELADIGLSRSDLPRVFDPAFAADHAQSRDYIAY